MAVKSKKPGKGSTGSYSSGRVTGMLSALLGKGAEASNNQAVDIPEFSDENNYIDNKGQLSSNPFSSNYNFWDKIAGRQDQSVYLNNQVALNRLTGDQALENLLKEKRSLIPIEEESTRRIGKVRTENDIQARNALDPLDIDKTFKTSYAAKGIAPTDLNGLSSATARKTLGDIGIAQTGNDLLSSVLSDPANQALLKAGILAKESQPIATFKKSWDTNLGPNEFMQRDATGNALLDKLLNPGIGYGSSEQMGTTKAKLGNMEYDVPTKIHTPGRYNSRIPIDPNKKAAVMGGSSSTFPFDLPSSIPTQVPAGLNPPPAPDQENVVDNLLRQIKKNSTGDPMADMQRILNAVEMEKLRKAGILDRLKGL